jgi:hypothetical protein
MRWAMVALLAPEFVLWRAYSQWAMATKLYKERNKILDEFYAENANRTQGDIEEGVSDAEYQQKMEKAKQRKRWCLEHGYFAAMGGYVVSTKGENEWIFDDGTTVTPQGILLLAKADKLPETNKQIIKSRAKSDSLAKTLVCVQACRTLLNPDWGEA